MKRWFLKAAIVLAVAAMLPASAWAYYFATSVTGIVSFDAKINESVTTGYPQPVSVTQEIQQTDNYSTSGTASGQVDTFYAKSLTLSGAVTTLDLTALTDPAGNAVNFARVRELIVQNTATTAGFDVKVSAGATNGVSWLPASGSGISCRYGSVFRLSDKNSTGAGNGNVVPDATHKTVAFDPGANNVTINVIIIGGSAAFVVLIIPGFRRHRRRVA